MAFFEEPFPADLKVASSHEPAMTKKTPLGSVMLLGALAIGAGIVLWKK
jgi:hypothetical protein